MRSLLLLLVGLVVLVRADLSVPRWNLAAAGLNNYIIFAGGFNGTDALPTVDLYDSLFNQWSTVGTITWPSMSLAAAALPSGFLIVGGTNGLLPLVSSDFFDTSSRSFVPYPPIGIARSELLGASAMGVAAFGGGVASSGFSNALSIWDTRANPPAWNESFTLAAARIDHAVASNGQFIIFAGGFAGTSFLSMAELLDASTMTLTVTTGLTKARARLAGAGSGRYFVFAGGADLTGTLANADLYDTQAGSWSSIAPLSVARSDLAAAAVGTKLVFAGGMVVGGTYSAAVDVFDTATLTWVATGKSLKVARAEMAAASVGSFAIFAGGMNQDGAQAASDMFRVSDLTPTTTAATTAATTGATDAAASTGSATTDPASTNSATDSTAITTGSTTASVISTDTTSTTGGISVETVTTVSTVDIADVTVTASTAASFGTTSVATITASTAATATTGHLPPPPTSSSTYIVDGNMEVNSSWTAPQTTIFQGEALTSIARLTVDGTAYLGGKAKLNSPDAISQPTKVRLVSADHLLGSFEKVSVTAPKDPKTGHCHKYTVTTVKPYTTVYAVNIVPYRVDCPTTHMGILIFAIVFGSIVLLALVIFLIIYFVKTRSSVYVKT